MAGMSPTIDRINILDFSQFCESLARRLGISMAKDDLLLLVCQCNARFGKPQLLSSVPQGITSLEDYSIYDPRAGEKKCYWKTGGGDVWTE